jgi:hypothetical protein
MSKARARVIALDLDAIVDAPEHYEYARAMGLLTWGTWDTGVRPMKERLQDFIAAYPLSDPMKFQGSVLRRTAEDEFGPGDAGDRRRRFEADESAFGALGEVLARYGLKLADGPAYAAQPIEVPPFREVARFRNQRLRRLYGAVDVEAENMDDAKAAELERLEKKRAADQIRETRERMRRELADGRTTDG